MKTYSLVIRPKRIEVLSDMIRILAQNGAKLHAEIPINIVAALKVLKIQRNNSSDSHDSTDEEQQPTKNLAGQRVQYWYPIKLSLPENKSRTILAESNTMRNSILKAIYRVQGFSSPLDFFLQIVPIKLLRPCACSWFGVVTDISCAGNCTIVTESL